MATETFVMAQDACGLARSMRNLFRTHRRKPNKYSGEAFSYQVLEGWAFLGLGAAILPQSRLSSGDKKVFTIASKAGKDITIAFKAAFSGSSFAGLCQAFAGKPLSCWKRIMHKV